MRNKVSDFNYGKRPLALGGDTTYDWIENEKFIYLGEW